MGYVANVLGVHHSTISRMLTRLRETGAHSRRPRQGRKRKTSVRDDHYLVLRALRNQNSTSTDFQNGLALVRNMRISALTEKQRIREEGLECRKASTMPLLTATHRRQRWPFARKCKLDSEWLEVCVFYQLNQNIHEAWRWSYQSVAKNGRTTFWLLHLPKGAIWRRVEDFLGWYMGCHCPYHSTKT